MVWSAGWLPLQRSTVFVDDKCTFKVLPWLDVPRKSVKALKANVKLRGRLEKMWKEGVAKHLAF